MWGQKQSAMIAEAMILNFALYNNKFTITKGINDLIREHNKGFSNIYFSDESIRNSFINGNIYLKKDGAKKILNKINKTQFNFLKFVHKLKDKNYNLLSENDILKLLQEYQLHLIFLQKMFRATDPSATSIIEKKVKKIISKKYEGEQIISIFTVLTTPVELDKTQLEIIDWYKLCKRKKTFKDSWFKGHIMRYPANFANSLSYSEITTHLTEKAKTSNFKLLKEQISQTKKSKRELSVKQEEIFNKFEGSDKSKLKEYCHLLQKIAVTRFEIKHCWSGAEILCLDFLKNISKRLGLNFETFFYSYNFSDIFNYFKTGRKLSENEIKDRLEYSTIHYNHDKLTYLYGQKAKEYFSNKYSINKLSTSLKGLTANQGNVVGRVKVIKVSDFHELEKESSNFKKGDILVTTMTSPGMVTIASKAAAIVTDEGGICSHAAIISRELKIPCIVGTHYATNMFKDGDIIEVDANKGIVRIINNQH